MIGFIGASLQFKVGYNSSHIELLLNDVCLTNLCEESVTVVWISNWSLVSFDLSAPLLAYVTARELDSDYRLQGFCSAKCLELVTW
jgi:hypothetical protein